MANKTTTVQSIDHDLIMDLLDEAGIRPGERERAWPVGAAVRERER